MAAEESLSQKQFVSLHHHEGKYMHHIDAHDQEGSMVGSMDWNKRSKRVMNISVSTRLRRQGIASHMWDLANDVAKEKGQVGPQHSPERTPEGDAWAKSVGGKLPAVKRCTACGEVGHLANENLC